MYPNTLNGSYNLLENHSTSRQLYPKQRNMPTKDSKEWGKPSANVNEEDEDIQGMKFSQMDDAVPGADGRTNAWITCHFCN